MSLRDQRLKLSAKLHEALGSDNVYFEPPESKKLDYPCIIYQRAKIDKTEADNTAYLLFQRFTVTHITKRVDSPVVDELLKIKNCEHDRDFKVDDLYHYVFTIYI
jgi:hypothetical protein